MRYPAAVDEPRRRSHAAPIPYLLQQLLLLQLLLAPGCTTQAPTREPAPSSPVAAAAAALPPPPATATISRGQAGSLQYLEVVPAGLDPRAPLPMIVFIHGLGDRPRTAFIDGVDLPARFILPQAPERSGRGYSWFPYRVGEQHPEFSAGIVKAAALLVDMLDELRENRQTLGLPIVTGFSQGGILSFAIAVHHPSAVFAVHPISGMLPPELWPEAPAAGAPTPPIRAVHGDADTVVPFASAVQTVETLGTRGFDVSMQAFAGVPHTQSEPMRRYMMGVLEHWTKRAQTPRAAANEAR